MKDETFAVLERNIDWYCARFAGKPEHPGTG